jgi:hypothetical protein
VQQTIRPSPDPRTASRLPRPKGILHGGMEEHGGGGSGGSWEVQCQSDHEQQLLTGTAGARASAACTSSPTPPQPPFPYRAYAPTPNHNHHTPTSTSKLLETQARQTVCPGCMAREGKDTHWPQPTTCPPPCTKRPLKLHARTHPRCPPPPLESASEAWSPRGRRWAWGPSPPACTTTGTGRMRCTSTDSTHRLHPARPEYH